MASRKQKSKRNVGGSGVGKRARQVHQTELPLIEMENFEEGDPRRYGVTLQTDAEREEWDLLFRMDIIPTKYACDKIMVDLGIFDDVMKLIKRIGWKKLLKGNWLTYRVPTLEFFSTLKVWKKYKGITFRLKNQEFHLTKEQLNNIFGTPNDGIAKPPSGWDRDQFWASITNGEDELFVPKDAKSSNIRNPVLRYIQKMISSSLLARHSTGNMRSEEILILWGMLSGTRIDAATLLMEQLERQQQPYGRVVSIGGLITPIASSLGLDLSDHVPESGEIFINRDLLVRMRMLNGRWRKPHKLVHAAGDYFPLPNTSLTTVDKLDDQSNWKMSTDRHREAAEIFKDPRLQPYRREQSKRVADDTDEEEDGMEEDQPESSARGCRMRALNKVDMDVIQKRFDNVDSELAAIKNMMNDMHKWHLNAGHFAPPPPQ